MIRVRSTGPRLAPYWKLARLPGLAPHKLVEVARDLDALSYLEP